MRHSASKAKLDGTDWRILGELQTDARLSAAELGRRVHLSAPAVATRVRRLEDAGVIAGYRIQVDLRKVGYAFLAFVRVRVPNSTDRAFEKALARRSEVLECHHVTGEDCFIAKVAAHSIENLEQVVAELGRFGTTTTSIVFSTPVVGRTVEEPRQD
jgi:Lrp/AsnC family leucine-responsive transcriptional regulator